MAEIKASRDARQQSSFWSITTSFLWEEFLNNWWIYKLSNNRWFQYLSSSLTSGYSDPLWWKIDPNSNTWLREQRTMSLRGCWAKRTMLLSTLRNIVVVVSTDVEPTKLWSQGCWGCWIDRTWKNFYCIETCMSFIWRIVHRQRSNLTII